MFDRLIMTVMLGIAISAIVSVTQLLIEFNSIDLTKVF